MTEQEHDQNQTVERRQSQAASDALSPAPAGKTGNKPVVVYIMVLFIAAFLLMALSLFMHQRSNTEVMGELQHSVSTLQEVQELQNQVIELQKELEETRDTAEAFQDANETSRNQAAHAEHLLEETQRALDWFWQVNEAYVRDDLDRCRELVEAGTGTQTPLSDYLPQDSAAAERYREILQALDAWEDQFAGAS